MCYGRAGVHDCNIFEAYFMPLMLHIMDFGSKFHNHYYHIVLLLLFGVVLFIHSASETRNHGVCLGLCCVGGMTSYNSD